MDYKEKFYKLRKIYFKLLQNYGAVLLKNIFLEDEIHKIKQEKYGNIKEVVVADFIDAIDKVVEEYPQLENFFAIKTEWKSQK